MTNHERQKQHKRDKIKENKHGQSLYHILRHLPRHHFSLSIPPLHSLIPPVAAHHALATTATPHASAAVTSRAVVALVHVAATSGACRVGRINL